MEKVHVMETLGTSSTVLLVDYHKAIDYHNHSLEIAKRIGDISVVGTCHYNLSRLYLDLYDTSITDNTSNRDYLKSTYSHLKDSISSYEKIGSNLVDDTMKINYHGRYADYYELAISIAWYLKDEDKYQKEAFELVQRAKSKAFIDLLSTTVNIHPIIRNESDGHEIEELVKREQELLDMKRAAQNHGLGLTDDTDNGLFTYPGNNPNVLKPGELVNILKELDDIYSRLEDFNPQYVSLRRPTPMSYFEILDKVNKFLFSSSKGNTNDYYKNNSKKLLVEYFVTPDGTYIFCISDGELLVERHLNLPQMNYTNTISNITKVLLKFRRKHTTLITNRKVLEHHRH